MPVIRFKEFITEKQAVITKKSDVEDILRDNNFKVVRTGGRHIVYGHPSGVTVAVPHSREIHPNTARDIIKLAMRTSNVS